MRPSHVYLTSPTLMTDRGPPSVSLLIVIGSSLSVAPVSEVFGVSQACVFSSVHSRLTQPSSAAHLPHSIPQIMINKTVIRDYTPDVRLIDPASPLLSLTIYLRCFIATDQPRW